MRIDRITATQTDGGIEICGYCQASHRWPTQRLWLQIRAAAVVPYCPADTLLPVALLPSMMVAEDLEIDGQVSELLLMASDQIQTIYSKWVKGARKIRVQCSSVAPPLSTTARGVASFFSGGVDSFFTLHNHLDELTDIILVHGFDIPLQDRWRYEQARSTAAKVASAVGKGLVEVSTNIRSLMDLFVSWEYSHGAALAAVALACSGIACRVYIPSSFPCYRLRPWGSHPLLDPLWSNGYLQVIHDDCSASRLDKVRDVISNWPLALQTLRVCWKNRPGMFNCGRCEKCLRTMLCLHIAGVLDGCNTLPHQLSPWAVARLKFKTGVGLAEEILSGLQGNSRLDKRLKFALRLAIFRTRLYLVWRTICGQS